MTSSDKPNPRPNPCEPDDDGYKAECIAAGWRWYDSENVLEHWTGERWGIAHTATVDGRERHNDSVYVTWKECAREALGLDIDIDVVKLAEAAGVIVAQNSIVNVGTWKWRARNGFYAGPFDSQREAAEDACDTLGLY